MHAKAGCLSALRTTLFTCALVASPLSACAAAPTTSNTAAVPMRSEQVNCLIPGQIKQLDNHTSYLSARRVIRTTREDCRNRGGEINSQPRSRKAKGEKRGVEPEAIKTDPPPGAGY